MLKKLIIKYRCQTLLDLGCGKNSDVRFLKSHLKYSVGVDIWEEDLNLSKGKQIHNDYVLADVASFLASCPPRSYDCVLAIGLVEHIDKQVALALIAKMNKIARKLVIVGTPNGFVPQDTYDGNPFQKHLSGFYPGDFYKLGFKVLGVDGPKFIRGDSVGVRFKPRIIFAVLANLLDPLLRRSPSLSFNLLAYKVVP